MIIKIMGTEHPAAYTVEARKKIEEHFGGSLTKEKIDEIADMTSVEKFGENALFLAAAMINAAKRREAVTRKLMGEEAAPYKEVDFSELVKIIELGEAIYIFNSALKTIAEGNSVSVEVLPEPKKKESE